MGTARQKTAKQMKAALDRGDLDTAQKALHQAGKQDPTLAADIANHFKEQRR